jgi:hypothetical protein
MNRVFAKVALTGSALLAAQYASLSPFRYEMIGWSRPGPKYNPRRPSHSIAQINRHTGRPHEHRREIARRLGVPA